MNRLADETSPYLLQHADNPVDWYPWGEEALARAREEDRPILLSIGYAACHWCHVMEHESFEDEETARLQNEHFVNVKVDREERPDLDAIYMDAVVTLTGHGGWPLTAFLTPEGEPFYGGTYFPPEPRHGLPSFRQVLEAVSSAYRERRADVGRSAGELVAAIERAGRRPPSSEPLTESLLGEAVRGLRASFDPEWGGFGGAPKFPPHSVLELLLRRGETEMVERTLDGMAAGGMYDLVGGGFHRYSVDERWLVPHFEKMLYDNALLVPAYLHAWLVTGRERYREVVEETVEYMLRDLLLPDGAFASSQDADTDGVEGLTYTWTAEEGVPAELLQPFEHGRSIIRGELDPRAARAAAREAGGAAAAGARRQGDRVVERPRARRAGRGGEAPGARRLARHRPWPGRVPARPALGRRPPAAQLPRRQGHRHRLPRRLRERRARALRAARRHRRPALARGVAPPGAARRRAVRGRRARRLLPHARPTARRSSCARRTSTTTRSPSGNSMLAFVLLRLARIYGDDELERHAVSVLRLVRDLVPRAPAAFGWALCALDLHFSPPREIAIVGSPDDAVAKAALAGYDPNAVVAFGPSEDVPLLQGKGLVDGKPAVYVCERFACQAPVTDPAALTV